jgi:hypothetical protein
MRFAVTPFMLTTTADRFRATASRLLSNLVACAWQSDTLAGGDTVAATMDAAGDVIFNAPGLTADMPGWLWTWSR